jgi:hypothetical protein
MRLTRLCKTTLAVFGALLLTASEAGAHSGHTVSYSTTSTALNANANTRSTLIFGQAEATSMETDLPAGVKLAHDDQFGNELSSNPNDEEQVGTGSAKAAWWLGFFCSTSTQGLTATWEEDMTGAPAGAVAHYTVTNAIGFDTEVYAIEQDDATDDYKLVIDLDEGRTCSSASQPTDAQATITTYGLTAGGREVSRNPSVSGCYSVTATFIEVGGTVHSGGDSQAYGTGTCP